MSEKKPPDFNLVLTTKSVPRRYFEVGVGWKSDKSDGYAIVLNPGVVLDWRMCREYFISLYPRRGPKDEASFPAEESPFPPDEPPFG